MDKSNFLNCESYCDSKTSLTCKSCEKYTCKECSCFVAEEDFDYFKEIPDELKSGVYCPSCYSDGIESHVQNYQEIMRKAEDVDVFTKIQTAETRLIRKIAKKISVTDCGDKEEALMRLAFLAASNGYGTIVNVDLVPNKVGSGSYKKQIWAGSGFPVNPKPKRKQIR